MILNSTIHKWLVNQSDAMQTCFLETWACTGVHYISTRHGHLLHIGRSAALIKPNQKVGITEFLRLSPVCTTDKDCDDSIALNKLEIAMREAKWTTEMGAVFNDHPASGLKSKIDNEGMATTLLLWSDIIDVLRTRLEIWEQKNGLSGLLKREHTISAGFGFPAPIRNNLHPDIVNDIKEMLTKEFTQYARTYLHKWRENLTGEFLTEMEHAGWNSPAEWNWLIEEYDRMPKPRLQAIKSFPWAANIIKGNVKVFTDVEKMRPLIPSLSKSLDIPENIIRLLHGMPSPNNIELSVIFSFIENSNNLPKTKDGWKCWQSVIQTMQYYPEKIRSFMNSGGWDSLNLKEFEKSMSVINDMIIDIRRSLLVPFQQIHEIPSDPLEIAIFWKSPMEVNKRIQLLMQDNGQARAGLLQTYSFVSEQISNDWLPLHEPYQTGHGLTAIPLCSDLELQEEHRRMHHCVDVYSPSCRVSGCHIVSFRDNRGNSVATAELKQSEVLKYINTQKEPLLSSRYLPPGYIQLKGIRNNFPSDQVYLAAWSHVNAMTMGTLKVDGAALADGLLERKSHNLDNIISQSLNAGYNIKAPHALKSALRAYSPFLPSSVKKKLSIQD